ncbi:helix-turn-helix domain-containing protein [Secundilactobacillus kimchicus]|uniref:helix-turn-helix transcriptional regulator n=1 Tax=Secundilactobacillus kimchicus TaxID=528209 RepID=UPI001C02CF43|nr:helix-turn-helix transcriptional regulator [Secundilactobacillus kimchicus]MBT9672680.1 helix-turn-helix domain-containing protein [Secundilactobacillus kimchicus]
MQNRVKQHRMAKGLSQIELARKVNLTRQTISLLEAQNYNPSLKVCLAIATALTSNLDTLFNPKYFH